MPVTYYSFLVRLWREPDARRAAVACDWQSEIEHIQSGQRWVFDTLDGMLNFLHQRASDLEMLNRSADETDPVRCKQEEQ